MRRDGAKETALTIGAVVALIVVLGWASNPPGPAPTSAPANQPGSLERAAQDAFSVLDKNVDGVLSPGEARESWVLRGRFGDADANRDGSIDRSEFAAYELLREDNGPGVPDEARPPPRGESGARSGQGDDAIPGSGNSRREAAEPGPVEEDFRKADRDRDGSLSFSEFSAFRTGEPSAGEPPPQQAGEAVITPKRGQAFDSIDVNGDGLIDYDEAAAVPMLHSEFDNADTDVNATIDRAEFSAFVLDRSLKPPELTGRFGAPITETPTPPE